MLKIRQSVKYMLNYYQEWLSCTKFYMECLDGS